MASLFDGHEFEEVLGVGDGQASLVSRLPGSSGVSRAAVRGVAKSRTRLSDRTELNL